MVPMDRRTSKVLEQPETIRQSIETVLGIPKGSMMFHRDEGYAALDENGTPKKGLSADFCRCSAEQVLAALSGHIDLQNVEVKMNDQGAVAEVRVQYHRNYDGQPDLVLVQYRS